MFKEKTNKSVRLYYGIFLGVFTAVVGALFIWQVLTIFYSSSAPVFERRPFTREIVLEALSKIDLFFWLWVGLVIVGFILWEVFPVKEKPRKICPDLQYARLKARLPKSAPQGLENEFSQVMQTERLIFGVNLGSLILLGISALVTVIYLCIPSNFKGESVTLDILNMVKVVLPVIVASGILAGVGATLVKFSVKKSLPAMQKTTRGIKQAETESRPVWYAKVEAFLQDKRTVLAIRVILAVVGVALIIWGALNGNARAVFIKAINICTECIGLG